MTALQDDEVLIEKMVACMSMEAKFGQMTQIECGSCTAADVGELGLGSVLSGGGGYPKTGPNCAATWLAMTSALHAASPTVVVDAGTEHEQVVTIGLLYGSDAVHGHGNVGGATIFPHNIGLGAVSDDDDDEACTLVERIGLAVGLECRATGVNWNFAPCVAVAQDLRWGRSYESYCRDGERVGRLGAALVRGLLAASVLPSVKHYVGDGGTAWGSVARKEDSQPGDPDGLSDEHWSIDTGDTAADESELRRVHLAPYVHCLAAGAPNVMASYSSWRGVKMHAHRYLLTDVLKHELRFAGFVVSDWQAVDRLHPASYAHAVAAAVNAGVDMVMVPFDARRFIAALRTCLDTAAIAPARIDDAEHRRLAAYAVTASAVLLQNRGDVLPLRLFDDDEVLVAGQAADDVGLACGGWTIEWQGKAGATTAGTTLLQALRAQHGRVVFEPSGQFAAERRGGIGIAVVHEPPYAEGFGDCRDPSIAPEQVALVGRLAAHCRAVVTVVYSGRPVRLSGIVDSSDAIVAAWLPGSEAGAGLLPLLVGRRPFTGRLPFDWPF